MKNGFSDYSTHLCIHELFERRAAGEPESIALVSGTTKYTYSELNRRANQLCRRGKAF